MTNRANIVIRRAEDEDGARIVAIVAGCFAEYEGCVIDPDLELPIFSRPKTAYDARPDGAFWVALVQGKIVGCVGLVSTVELGGVELQKLYVSVEHRRQGIGQQLCALIEERAHRRQASFIELWSDTRFKEAHHLYQKRGYQRGASTRELNDASRSVEFYYRKAL